MDVYDAVQQRRSIRKFLEIPVEWEKIGEMLDAGRLAPSAGNVQDWKFIVVIDPDKRWKVAEACIEQYWMAAAPVQIIVCSEPKKSERFYGDRGEKIYAIQNCAAAVENMLLMAEELELGACWVGAFDIDILRSATGIPETVVPQAVIPVGYPDEKPSVPLKFDLPMLVFFDEWGARFKDMATVKGEYDVKVQKALKQAKELLEKVRKKLKEVPK